MGSGTVMSQVGFVFISCTENVIHKLVHVY